MARNSFPTAFAGRHALRDSRLLCCALATTRCIIAPIPHRYINVPSYFEYVLQICQPRMRRLALSRDFHHPRPTHRTACDSLSPQLLGTDLRVQMTIPLQAREEGRLAILPRASTKMHGQTTPIPTTPAPSPCQLHTVDIQVRGLIEFRPSRRNGPCGGVFEICETSVSNPSKSVRLKLSRPGPRRAHSKRHTSRHRRGPVKCREREPPSLRLPL